MLCLRMAPFLKWRIVLKPATPGPVHSKLTTYSVMWSMLIVMTTWGGVLMLAKESFRWSFLIWSWSELMGLTVKLVAFTALVTMLCIGLTLTRLADWMFYRRRWTLPLLVAVVLCAAITLLLAKHDLSPGEALPAIILLVTLLAAQPLTTLLVLGMAGYRLAPRSKQPGESSSAPSAQGAGVAEGPPVGVLPQGLRGAHVAALTALAVLFCTVVPTGLLDDHILITISGKSPAVIFNRANDEVIAAIEKLGGKVTFESGGSGGRVIASFFDAEGTDAGLEHLEELTQLDWLILRNTKVTDAGLMHLKGLTGLEWLDLRNTQVTDAGVRNLKQSLPKCNISK